MSTITKTYTSAGTGMPDYARPGAVVSFTMDPGCVLRKSADCVEWVVAQEVSPFVHSGEPAHYRIDLDEYTGTPKTYSQTIQ